MGIGQEWVQQAQMLDIEGLKLLKKVLVIAPHQDDESLGCGGLIALLRQQGIPVHVVFTTDGSMSHPNSVKYPTSELIVLREREAVTALHILGVEAEQITFLRLKDGSLPTQEKPGFDPAVQLMQQVLHAINPQTVIVPWQRDPHPDHRAAWQITNAAIAKARLSCRRLEYLIWLWERAAPEDLPLPEEVKVWKADIASVTALKQRAIMAHTSQTTGLIDDDPEGFTLSPEVLNHFASNQELFVERN